MERISHPQELIEWKAKILSSRAPDRKTIVVSSGTCGQASGSVQVIEAIEEEIEKRKLTERVGVEITGCHGFCEMEPNVVIYPERIFYKKLKPEDIPKIFEETILNNRIILSYVYED